MGGGRYPVVRREYRLAWAAALFFVLAGSLPHLYGHLRTPEDEVFMGLVGRGTPGGQGYLMLAKQVRDGGHLMQNRMTPEPTPHTYFNLEWWIFGKTSAWTGLSLIGTFHFWRIISVVAFCLAFYYLLTLALPRRGQRSTAFLLVTCTAGFGWVVWLLNGFAGLELWRPPDLDGITVPGYLVNKPHFIRAGIFAALFYAFLIRGEQTQQRRWFVWAGLAGIGHSVIRPYHFPESYLMLALLPVVFMAREGRFDRRRAENHALAGAVLFPAVLYYAWMAHENTLGMAGWVRQSLFLLQDIAWLGAPFLIVAAHFLIAGCWGWRRAPMPMLVIGLWLLVAWLLNQAFPYFIAGHEAGFYAYVMAPPILLAGAAWPALRRAALAWGGIGLHRRRRLAAAAIILLGLPSAAYGHARFYWDLHYPMSPWRYYITRDMHGAMEWLRDNTPPASVVLASRDTSQFIPVVAGNRVVTGHDMLTAHYEEKNGQLKRFLATRGDDDYKRWMLREYDVRYVFMGPFEWRQDGFEPADHPWLEPVFHQGAVTVYAVDPEGVRWRE